MALSAADVTKTAERMISALDGANDPTSGSIGVLRRYLKGDHDLPYMPTGASQEFARLARRSITNWLPLIADTYSKALFVDGYRPSRTSENASAWKHWQANGLDARQSVVHRSVLEYGTAYVLVLPGTSGPAITPLTPNRVWTFYSDPDAEFPEVALIRRGKTALGLRIFELVDDTNVYTLTRDDDGRLTYHTAEAHRLNVCPIVRFRDRLDGDNVGIIRPLLPLQDRVNETVFAIMIALQYASFRQRWATGLAVPMKDVFDEETGEKVGEEPVEPFESAVNRLWVSDSETTKFGDFAQTEVSGHLNAYKSTVQTLAAIAQTPPHVLLGDLVNLSADALAAAEASTQRKVSEYETIFGEAWEQVFRLAAYAADDLDGALDESSQVRWRDTEARSLAQTVDALGKIAQMLSVPPEVLWERIPGVTDGDVERWKEAAGRQDSLAALAGVLDRQGQAANERAAAPETPPEQAA